MKPLHAELLLLFLGAVFGACVAAVVALALASNSGAGWRSRHVKASELP